MKTDLVSLISSGEWQTQLPWATGYALLPAATRIGANNTIYLPDAAPWVTQPTRVRRLVGLLGTDTPRPGDQAHDNLRVLLVRTYQTTFAVRITMPLPNWSARCYLTDGVVDVPMGIYELFGAPHPAGSSTTTPQLPPP